MTTMSQALVNDVIRSFLVFQLLLLAVMLFAVIRLPPYTPGTTAEESRPAPARPEAVQLAPARPPAAPVGSRPQIPQTGVAYAQFPPVGFATHAGQVSMAGQPARMRSGRTKYVARHVATPEPRTIRRPKVSGAPPWGPAPKPPSQYP